ncbi:MAG TPA: cyclic nucleotide-binding domain-containing protein [Gammaproteobacteria bacterium]
MHDTSDESIYLLEGAVELSDGKAVIGKVKAGTEQALNPLSAEIPRQHTATAIGNVDYLSISSALMDRVFTWDQTGIYQVEEIGSAASEGGDDWMTALMQVGLMQRLPASNIQAVFSRLERVEFEPGETLVRQGDVGDHFYFIVSGRCRVTRESAPNEQRVPLVELMPGDVFGEDALISGATRNATVEALIAGTAMRLGKTDFLELLNEPVLKRLDRDGAARAVAKGGQWLDVRLPTEFSEFHLDGAVNVPLCLLRQKLADLDPQVDYVVCCDNGDRSSAAAFIMAERNYRAAVLDGGLDASSR